MTDITPEDSVVPVFTDDTPRPYAEDPMPDEARITSLQDSTRASILTMIDGIQVLRDFADGTTATNAQINANPAVYMKAIVREVIEVERNLIRIARLMYGMTDSTNTGA